VKTAVLAPIPNARIKTATIVNPLALKYVRKLYLRSCSKVLISAYLVWIKCGTEKQLTGTSPCSFLLVFHCMIRSPKLFQK
jgi:hypothetical protein